MLSVLERFHVPGTFFVVGKMVRYFSPSRVGRFRPDDVLGDHTESHAALAQLSAHDQYEQLFEQIARIELVEGPVPHLFRPPYGSFNATTIRELKALHLLMVLWSVDSGDYLKPGVPTIVQRVLAGAKPGAIILMHDAGGDRTQTIDRAANDHPRASRARLSPRHGAPAARPTIPRRRASRCHRT